MQPEPVSGMVVTVRLPESLTIQTREAMKLAGVWRISDFIRQALVLRVREVHETARRRADAGMPIHFARRRKSEEAK